MLDNWVLDFGWICLESSLHPAISESNSVYPIIVERNIVGGGRGDTYTFSYMTSPDSIMIAFGIQQAVSVS